MPGCHGTRHTGRFEGGRPCEKPWWHTTTSLEVPIGELLRAERRGAKSHDSTTRIGRRRRHKTWHHAGQRGEARLRGCLPAEARTSGDTLLNYGQNKRTLRSLLKLRHEQLAETETEVGDAGCSCWWIDSR